MPICPSTALEKLRDLRWAAYERLTAQVHDLLYLFWEATRRCNLSCRHCGSDCSADGRAGLPARRVLEVLRRVDGAYGARSIALVVTGGEPLLRPDLLEIVSGAARLGYSVGIVTNGILLDETRAAKLLEAGVRNVVVSLDGPEEFHDWLRNRRGAFRLAVGAITSLRRVGMPSVEAVTCATPRSLDLLPATYEIVCRLGAHGWRIFNIFPAGRAAGNRDLVLDGPGLGRLVELVAALRQRGTQEGLRVNLTEEGFLGWDFERQVRDQPYFCRAGINIAGLLADGTIAACPNLPGWMAQGHIERDDFVEVWEDRFQLFRDRSWTRRAHCGDCPKWRVCWGNSLHLWRTPDAGPAWCHYEVLHPGFRDPARHPARRLRHHLGEAFRSWK